MVFMSQGTKDTIENLVRPPIVVVLGHVDHGKTSLLDVIRKTRVADKESGGITQHIGAYQTVCNGKTITFLDTPGHEAFSSIRSRGAKVADVAILVVASDEGIKPQTKEAIRIIKEENTPFIVAINKIDKENSNPQKVRQELAGEEVLVEDWGGTVPVVEISAKENKNIDELLDMVLLVSELEDLKQDLSSTSEGFILESHMDKRKGFVATALVKKGFLEIGDWMTVGRSIGKIKSMDDFLGKPLTKALPSQPVSITGWSTAPSISKMFKASHSKEEAERIAEDNTDLLPIFQFFKNSPPDMDSKKVLNLIFKSDVSSSLEAIESTLSSIKSEEVAARVISYDVGNIIDADVKLAQTTKARIYGFRVVVEEAARKLAEKDNLKIKTFDIIYELIEEVRRDMATLLDPEVKIIPLGRLRILAVFKTDAHSQVVGGKVISGKAQKGAFCDVMRGGQKLAKGKIVQLQHNKEESPEVREGLDAGIKFEIVDGQDFTGIADGDILEMYVEEESLKTL